MNAATKSASAAPSGWPDVRGSLRLNHPLAPLTWFRVGGPATGFFLPKDQDDLAEFLKNLDPAISLLPIGVASNLLIRDGGIDQVLVRLGGPLASVDIKDTEVVAGAGALDQKVAAQAARAGLAGLEFMIGIPGTIGGAIAMNAGAFGGETAENLRWIEVILRDGTVHRLPKSDLAMQYRQSVLPDDAIVLRAAFSCVQADPDQVRQRMAEIKAEREAAQPLRVATGGSTFKNPPGERAWQLIDQAGCRGLRLGAASVSEKHCNFLINHGGATALEIEHLGEQVRERVKDSTGIGLEWEIKRIGRPQS